MKFRAAGARIDHETGAIRATMIPYSEETDRDLHEGLTGKWTDPKEFDRLAKQFAKDLIQKQEEVEQALRLRLRTLRGEIEQAEAAHPEKHEQSSQAETMMKLALAMGHGSSIRLIWSPT